MKKDEHRVYESLCLHAYLSLTDKHRPLVLHSHFSILNFTHFIKKKKKKKAKETKMLCKLLFCHGQYFNTI